MIVPIIPPPLLKVRLAESLEFCVFFHFYSTLHHYFRRVLIFYNHPVKLAKGLNQNLDTQLKFYAYRLIVHITPLV